MNTLVNETFTGVLKHANLNEHVSHKATTSNPLWQTKVSHRSATAKAVKFAGCA